MASNFECCGECRALDISKSSVVWCCECEDGLCSDCEKRHKAVKATKSHQTTPIDRYQNLPTDLLKASQTCPEHNERYVTYCDVHECTCCVKCMLESHNDCKSLKPIDDIVRDIKTSNVLRECEESLAEIHENISTIIKDRKQNSSTLKNERKRLETEIRETKRKVIRYLDTIEAELLQQLVKVEESENFKIKSLIVSLEQAEKEIDDMKVDLAAIKEHATELQVFMTMKNIEQKSSMKRAMIDELFSGSKLNNSILSVELNKTLRTIEKNIPTFGRVSLEIKSPSVVLKKRKDKEAQLHVSNVKSIDSIGLDLIRSTDLQKTYLWGCCFLPDGRYAVASYEEQCIVVMAEDGSRDCQIDVKPYRVIDITHIPSTNTLAATTRQYRKHYISIIDLNTRKITRSIPCETVNYGITLIDRTLYYCARDVGLCKMSLDTEKITTIKTIPGMSYNSYIASHDGNLYYTYRDAGTVTCCSMNGATKWEFKDENVLTWPEGISVDCQGNIYILDSFNHNLVVLSPDSLRHSLLLSRKDGLRNPIPLDIDKGTKRLLFTDNRNAAFLYKLKYNFIPDLFEMCKLE